MTIDLDPRSRSPGCGGHEHVVSRLSPKNENGFKPNLVGGYNGSRPRTYQLLGNLPPEKKGVAGGSRGGQFFFFCKGRQVIYQIEGHHDGNPVI